MLWATIRQLASRVTGAYATAPTARQWIECACLLAAFTLIGLPVGFASGLISFKPTSEPLATLVAFAVLAFFMPSLFEETLFRALVLPRANEHRPASQLIWSGALSVALFVLGHPLAAWLWAPSARPLLYDGVFLALTAVFGTMAVIAYYRSGSIWPSLIMHWTVVVTWKLWFGGWIMAFGPSPA
jgi:predicted Abi (CAAX) family protease